MIISAVIPLHNKANTIARSLLSVLQQSRHPDFLIVVDDASTDNSVEACKATLAASTTEIDCRVISIPHAGVSVARNTGADAVESDLICFLDADDVWLPNHLDEIERLHEMVPDAGILSTRSSWSTGDGRWSPATTSLVQGFCGRVPNGLAAYRAGYGILHTSSVAISRDAWRRSGGFLKGARKSQDIQLWLRLLLQETFAHSDKCTAVRHDEASGVGLRSGAVPAHFSFFLESSEGRPYLANCDLMRFLATNLAVQIIAHRLQNVEEDAAVAKELLKLSRSLPLAGRLKAMMCAKLPLFVVEYIVGQRKKARSRSAAY